MASTDQQNTAAEPPPAKLPCFVKGLEAAFSGGVLGYVFGFGSKMVMFRGSGGFKARWAVSALEGKSCARTFATFGGIYAAAMCYSRRLRLKNDAIDGAVAGCSTGLLIGFQSGAGAMGAAQSCLGLGVVSYYLEKLGVGTPPEAFAASTPPTRLASTADVMPPWMQSSVQLLLKPAAAILAPCSPDTGCPVSWLPTPPSPALRLPTPRIRKLARPRQSDGSRSSSGRLSR